MFELDRTQRWLQAVIMHPDGIVPGMRGPSAQLHMNVSPDDLETVLTRSSSQTAAERLAIYGRAYHARLTECLQAEFHVLLHAIGDELFDLFARAYLSNCPSRSFTLGNLGQDFPGFLESTRPDQPADDAEEQWPDFICDLARLERAFAEVFDGPGVEGQSLPSAETLRTFAVDRDAQVRMTPVVCLRLLAFQYPVHHYFHSVRREENPTVPLPSATFLAMNRRDYVVRMVDLSAAEYQLLSALIDGETVSHSLERASDSSNQIEHLIGCLHTWCEHGFFSAIGHLT